MLVNPPDAGDGRAPAPVTLVSGPESFLRERAVAEIRDAVRRVDPELDLTHLSAADTSPDGIREALSPSLFTTSRVAVLSDIEQADDDLAAALVDMAATPPDGGVLVLVHPGGVKGKRLLDALRRGRVTEVRCDAVKRAEDLQSFVIGEARRSAGRIDADAAARLVDVVGADLRGLASMTQQLVADAEGRVDLALVNAYVEGRADVKGWDIADLAVTGQTRAALSEMRWALAGGTDAVLVVGALAGSIRQLVAVSAVRRGQRDGDVARDLKVPSWKVGVLRRQLRGWTPAGLARALQAVARADLDIKGGATDQALTLTELLLAVGEAHSDGRTDRRIVG